MGILDKLDRFDRKLDRQAGKVLGQTGGYNAGRTKRQIKKLAPPNAATMVAVAQREMPGTELYERIQEALTQAPVTQTELQLQVNQLSQIDSISEPMILALLDGEDPGGASFVGVYVATLYMNISPGPSSPIPNSEVAVITPELNNEADQIAFENQSNRVFFNYDNSFAGFSSGNNTHFNFRLSMYTYEVR